MGYKNGPKFFFSEGVDPQTPKSATAWAYRPKPSLHELNLIKFPIKKL